jgi:glycosyltransferase involved in cell wall biosynthesis
MISSPCTPGRATGIAFLSNALDPPSDEGTKRCAAALAAALGEEGAAVVSIGQGRGPAARKLLLDGELIRSLRARSTRAILYLPTQSATVGSIVRAGVIRRAVGAKLALLALQPRRIGATGRLLGRLSSDLLLSPSPPLLEAAARAGIRTQFVALGVDTHRFRPVDPTRKRELRMKHGLPLDRPIALHVGHASRARDIEHLARLTPVAEPVVVIGRAFGADETLVSQLRAGGVRVIDAYLPNIEELYQAADVYVFPVRNEQAAIAAPLSVLEAAACDLPIVSTPFGALPTLFRDGDGVSFVADAARFEAAVRAAIVGVGESPGARAGVLAHDWRHVARTILELVESL